VSVDTNVREGVELLGYRLEAVIGLGGMGVVYRAVDLRLKRTVALKLMAPELALDERFRERFAREAELAMSLEHPNVIPIHDAGEVEGRLFLAMRLVEGGTLRSLLREEGTLAAARTIALVRQVANALDAAHAKGLVHRDVKPSNVLLDQNEHVYLADFGLTRRLDEQGGRLGEDRTLGTPAYLAPEQIEGGPVDGRADVYSLGCLLYECLTGEPPFPRGSRLAVAWAHLEEEPPPASGPSAELPEAIDGVLGGAMAKAPAARFQTCGALVEAAESALGLHAAPRRRRWPVLVAAAAVLLASATLATALVVNRGPAEATGSPLQVKRNSLVRLDPLTNSIEAVVPVGPGPAAAVVQGRTVWVYNNGDGSVSEVDADSNSVRHTTDISSTADDTSPVSGPILAADGDGAWVIGYDYGRSRGVLTRVRAGGVGARTFDLAGHPKGVAVGKGSVWVLLTQVPGAQVVRVDPRTGTVAERRRLSQDAVAGGIAVGAGAVWTMDFSAALLTRLDLRSGAIRTRDLGEVATPPVIGFGSLWICAVNPGSSMLRVDPRTMRNIMSIHSIPAEDGSFTVGFGSLWRHDVPSGTVMRFDPATGKRTRTIRVTPTTSAPVAGLSPTDVAAGAGAVWVSLA
jgi:serine/threonine protein kinase